MLTPEIAVDLISHAVQITALIVCVLVIPSLIGGLLVAIFQAATPAGAAIRIGFDGDHPVLPPAEATRATPPDPATVEFWPDEIYPDD